ncbi:MAG: SGNH/GDSL hydrolase family protein [Chloroflexi bacterium]|nr:SGNH/GDSL hydrolase family protein [Chloroflexota bacterium]
MLLLGILLTAAGCGRAADRPLVYVALGASDSVGIGAANPHEQGWVARLHGRLPSGTRLVNLGVSGFTLAQAVEQSLPVAVAARPDVVTVWLAVNDLNARVSVEQYERDLDRLLGTLVDAGARRILVGNVPDLTRVPVYRSESVSPEELSKEVARWNAAISRQVARHGAVLVDLHDQWTELTAHPEYVSVDGFHPSAAGYERLAEVFYRALVAER